MVVDKNNNLTHIFFAANNEFAVPLGVAITSIVEHANFPDDLRIYVMDGGISHDNVNKIANIAKNRIEFIKIKNDIFLELPKTKELEHATEQTYYRFIIPTLKPELSKALYLDCDLIVKKPIEDIWEINIEGYYAAACEDTWNASSTEWKKKLGLLEDSFYFNAGVILLNLQKMREDGVVDKFFEQAIRIKDIIRWKDQDVLNLVLQGRVKLLPLRWNFQVAAFFDNYPAHHLDHDIDDEIKLAKLHPAIIHFVGPIKPWQSGCKCLLRYEYYLYLIKSPWQSSFPNEKCGEIITVQEKWYKEQENQNALVMQEYARRIDELLSSYCEVVNSKSWRLTAPLRKIRSFFVSHYD
jgi:lipopolysaccharide biosynthesis glycosyltransferase